MSKKALGRGFEGLIPTNFNVSDVATPGERVRQIEVSLIFANPDQPRKQFDEDALKELSNSIEQHGVIQPIVVTPQDNKYRIVAGERRFRASQMAGLKKIPSIIRDHEALEELEIALVENVQRVDLSPLEQAVSIVRLRDQFSLTTKQIAKKLGKAEPTISNIVRLLQLPDEAVKALQENKISEGHARTILALKTDEKEQLNLLNTIIAQKLSVRDAEAIVQQKRVGPPRKKTEFKEVNTLLEPLSKKLKASLKVKPKSENSGQISVSYTTIDELKNYLDKLNS
jgi:ParB family chromosome partitioning protein